MEGYSEIITEFMKHVEDELEHIDPKSINRSRLYGNTHTSIVANVKLLSQMDPNERRQRADALFREQLQIEIGRVRQKR